MKHTPGPWSWSGVGRGSRKIFLATDTSTYHVANIEDDIGRNDMDANARLIAAAPEMLSVLMSVKDVLCQTIYDPNGNHRSGAIINLIDVIAKATGGDK